MARIISKNGFTLIEMMISLLIVAIIATMATVVFRDVWRQTRMQNVVAQIVASLHYARSEAIARESVIVLCGSRNAVDCDGDWQRGQIVRPINHKPLRVYSIIPPHWQLQWKGSFQNQHSIAFNSDGFTQAQQGRIEVIAPNGLRSEIIITRRGRIRVV